jgi:hypothetical protein
MRALVVSEDPRRIYKSSWIGVKPEALVDFRVICEEVSSSAPLWLSGFDGKPGNSLNARPRKAIQNRKAQLSSPAALQNFPWKFPPRSLEGEKIVQKSEKLCKSSSCSVFHPVKHRKHAQVRFFSSPTINHKSPQKRREQ